MTPKYDSHGAIITETIHEIIDTQYWPRTNTTPAEGYAQCACGWEYTSIESIGGGVEPYGTAFEEHVEETHREDSQR